MTSVSIDHHAHTTVGRSTLLLTLNDVAEELRISRAEVERTVARGHLKRVKIGRLTRVTRSELEAFVSRLERGDDA